ncbi:hypothetical protein D9613_011112 [Agrocybe pediades]|uniref:C2 domain-containing protein n=1 Tax=Agrocybe pediades TaxID=84607 RepID=A0A8H4QKP8_9AGAR|nr:hypothetical protein D9613_011112 [Agrocybe pediades]
MEKNVDIEVAVVGGRELLNTHKLRLNPTFYVSLKCLDEEEKRTQGGGKGSKAPEWNQNFVFAANLTSSLHVEVYCVHGHTREDHIIGQADLDLFSVERNKDFEVALRHTPKKSTEEITSGYLTLRIRVAMPVTFKVQESNADFRSLHYVQQMERIVGIVSQEELKQLSPTWVMLVGNLDMVASLAEKISDLDSRAAMALGAVGFMLQVLVKQIERDEKIEGLGAVMADLYTYVRDGVEIEKIATYQKFLDKLLTQTAECAYFIAEYRKVKAFATRAVVHISSDADSMIDQFQAAFGELKINLILGSTLQTAVVSYRILQTVENIEALIHVNNLSYLRNVGWDSGRTCLRGTRQSVIDEVLLWASSTIDIDNGSSKQICVLSGPAGCGKSTMAHTIAQAFHEQHRLGASVFLQGDTAGANSQSVSSSIIFQLAGYNSAIKARVAERLKSDPSLASADVGQQFPRLLVETMNEGVASGDTALAMVGPTLIVIDGIHEIHDPREQNRILTAIADDLVHLPPNFRILLTSQDGDMVAEIFGRVARRCHSLKITYDNPRGETPKEYMSWCLSQLSEQMPTLFEQYASEDLHTKLMDQSMGVHLWIDTLYRSIQFFHRHTESTATAFIQRLLANKVPHSKEDAMDNLYRVICTSIPYPDHFFKDVLLNFIHSTHALSFTLAHQPIALACVFDDSTSDCGVITFMRQLALIVERGKDEDGNTLLVLHPSFEDFLVTERRAFGTDFFIARGASKQVLEVATARIEVMNNLLESHLSKPEIQENRDEKHISLPIPENLHYACCTWAYCLDLCGTACTAFSRQYLALLQTLETFVSFHLIQWMEYMGVMNLNSHTPALLERVFNWSKKHLSSSTGTFKIHQCLLNLDIEKIAQGRLGYTSWAKVSSRSEQVYKTVRINEDGGKTVYAVLDADDLPNELTKLDVEKTHNWSKITVHADLDWMRTPFKANECFVLTPQLVKRTGAGESAQVKQVTFRIKSLYDREAHRPYFTSHPPYEASYGWFDAVIIRDLKVDPNVPEGEFQTHVKTYIKEAVNWHSAIDMKGLQVTTVRNPHRKADDDGVWSDQQPVPLFDNSNEENIKDTYRSYDVWYIQKHIPIYDQKVYEITWTDADQEEEAETLVADKPEGSSIGKGVGFVKLLQPGDRIAVISRNKGRGWMQHMQSIEVEVLYSS